MSWKNVVIIITAIVVIGIVFNTVVYFHSDIACGKVIGQGQTKGANYIRYKFQIGNQTVYGSESSSVFVDLSLDSLKKMDCVKIQYSQFIFDFNRIVDLRILKE